MIVVDASLAAKWFLDEIDSDAARRFLAVWTNRIIAPDLLATEVAGTLVRQANMDRSLAKEARALLSQWRWMQEEGIIRLRRPDGRRMEEAALLAMRLGHPLPDCIYLALAMETGCELATCDVKFRDRAVATYPGIRLLSDYTAAAFPTP